MSAESLTEEQRAQRLRQRLWGATILIAIAVIVLPLLLDGSGSESQFRRVESLRQEPTRVINADGSRQTVLIPEALPVEATASGNTQRSEGFLARLKRRFTENPKSDADARQQAPAGSASVPVAPVYNTDPNGSVEAQAARIAASQAASQAGEQAGEQAALATPPAVESDNSLTDSRAWVVQAGSFREEANALAVRDRLRSDGYPSFVSTSNDGSVFRVRVGPMVNKQQAGTVQKSVMELLGREAIVMPYP